MKKVFALIAVAAMVAFAAPAFAANPFADVPVNHWAYDAVSQLAASGIVAGYPDGAYKGAQPATRYEMAAVVARALANVDMNKASKQDLEMLKKLVVEFKGELDALGVKVDKLDSRVAVLENGIGGWKLSGEFQFDSRWAGNDGSLYTHTGDTDFQGTRYWINLQKHVDDKVDVAFCLGNADEWMDRIGHRVYGDLDNDILALQRVYATVKLPFDWTMVVGKQDLPDFEAAAGLSDGTSWLSDEFVAMKGFSFSKSFAKGSVNAFYARYDIPAIETFDNLFDGDFGAALLSGDNYDAAFYGIRGEWTPNEKFAMGGNYMVLDIEDLDEAQLSTYWADAKFQVKPGVALKGAYYWQDMEAAPEKVNAYKAIVDVDQSVLKHTALWVEYANLEAGFLANPWAYAYDNNTLMVPFGIVELANGGASDIEVWNVKAHQAWNNKWSTYERFVKSNAKDLPDFDAVNWTMAVKYQYTPALSFELAYDMVDFGDMIKAGLEGLDDDNMIRFRTHISF
jgi:hypothetical protein